MSPVVVVVLLGILLISFVVAKTRQIETSAAFRKSKGLKRAAKDASGDIGVPPERRWVTPLDTDLIPQLSQDPASLAAAAIVDQERQRQQQ